MAAKKTIFLVDFHSRADIYVNLASMIMFDYVEQHIEAKNDIRLYILFSKWLPAILDFQDGRHSKRFYHYIFIPEQIDMVTYFSYLWLTM